MLPHLERLDEVGRESRTGGMPMPTGDLTDLAGGAQGPADVLDLTTTSMLW